MKLCANCGGAALSDWNDFLLGKRKRIAETIIRRRLELGLTQKQLAEKTGLKQSSIARIESAKFFLSTKQLFAICEALDLEVQLMPK